jgi:hypothetical protein
MAALLSKCRWILLQQWDKRYAVLRLAYLMRKLAELCQLAFEC